ncbi:hypothetical protein KIN20_002550 [Parelaphostrongylus tenuis]|uniref:Uncharacterized protein n=1 Tax=Parelaphostrongylus tenuis TaxID=148309 RepID=A0AAD5QHV1_PARTN|nr:hypothetical protein KIN20_002550 [Parelaphostrongylus tenuis]
MTFICLERTQSAQKPRYATKKLTSARLCNSTYNDVQCRHKNFERCGNSQPHISLKAAITYGGCSRITYYTNECLATARAATRTLVLVVCCYLISNVLTVALVIWEYLDRNSLLTKYERTANSKTEEYIRKDLRNLAKKWNYDNFIPQIRRRSLEEK